MYCRNCGKDVNPQAMICTNCGAPPLKGASFCQHCGTETNPLAELCVKCGLRLGKYADPNAKSKLVAGLLGIFLGALGVHRFYLGFTGIGIAQIAVSIVTCGIGSLWGLIEGILILTGNINKDAMGRDLTD